MPVRPCLAPGPQEALRHRRCEFCAFKRCSASRRARLLSSSGWRMPMQASEVADRPHACGPGRLPGAASAPLTSNRWQSKESVAAADLPRLLRLCHSRILFHKVCWRAPQAPKTSNQACRQSAVVLLGSQGQFALRAHHSSVSQVPHSHDLACSVQIRRSVINLVTNLDPAHVTARSACCQATPWLVGRTRGLVTSGRY